MDSQHLIYVHMISNHRHFQDLDWDGGNISGSMCALKPKSINTNPSLDIYQSIWGSRLDRHFATLTKHIDNWALVSMDIVIQRYISAAQNLTRRGSEHCVLGLIQRFSSCWTLQRCKAPDLDATSISKIEVSSKVRNFAHHECHIGSKPVDAKKSNHCRPTASAQPAAFSPLSQDLHVIHCHISTSVPLNPVLY